MKFLQSKIRVVALLGIALFGIVGFASMPALGQGCAMWQRGGEEHAQGGSTGVKPGDSGDAGSADWNHGIGRGICIPVWQAAGRRSGARRGGKVSCNRQECPSRTGLGPT